jgi:hypothetical protein
MIKFTVEELPPKCRTRGLCDYQELFSLLRSSFGKAVKVSNIPEGRLRAVRNRIIYAANKQGIKVGSSVIGSELFVFLK